MCRYHLRSGTFPCYNVGTTIWKVKLMGLLNAMPGAAAQGLIWGIMAVGVYITFKILDLADLTVDGSMVTGMAVCAMLMTQAGWNVWPAMLMAFLAGMATGLITGLFHTIMGIPAILSGILTQLILWSVNLKIMGKANQALPARSFDVLVTQMFKYEALVILALICMVLVGILYWFFLRCFHPCHRLQRKNGPCPGHQHRSEQSGRPGAFQRHRGVLWCSAGPVLR